VIFSTTIFVFLFLPLFLAGYYLLPFRHRSGWILLGSWVFYAWWRLDFLSLIVATTIWTYGLGAVVARERLARPSRAKAALALGCVLNLGILAYFKYFNFGVESLNALLQSLGGEPISAWRVILPIGISFYVFQATSYLVDLYRDDAPEAGSYVELAAYISLFPQLIAGPILRYKDLAEQFRARSHTFEKFSEGALRFMLGFCKKVLIADSVAVIADTAFALETPGFVGAWLGALAYSAQLYFDFTGYSDMAIGLGLMMGFRFIENFNYPYISQSITEFWRRWHISLSTWLRDYLYIPLGGNRLGPRRTYLNIMTVMLLGGLWHGAAWTFVVWGAWHGGLLVLERLQASRAAVGRSADPRSTAAHTVWATARTMLLVTIGWVVFRAPSFSIALEMYRGMLGLDGLGPLSELSWQIGGFSILMLGVSFVLIYSAPYLGTVREGVPVLRLLSAFSGARVTALGRALVVPLFLLSVLKLTAEAFSPFLYFQF